jgi:hypothetical protein
VEASAVLTLLRRALSYRVSVADLTEIAMRLRRRVPGHRAGMVAFHPDGVQRIQARREEQLHLPAGTNYQLLALGEASVSWPVILVLPAGVCAHRPGLQVAVGFLPGASAEGSLHAGSNQ